MLPLPFTSVSSAQSQLHSEVEAILFASHKPLETYEILEILQDPQLTSKQIQQTVEDLKVAYETRGSGLVLAQVKGEGYEFQTAPQHSHLLLRMFAKRPRPLSRAAQETLSIVAYRQPVTRADIDFIRGVDSGALLKLLMEKNLIRCVGRKEDSGRALIFGTTSEFLKTYGLSSLSDLPPLLALQTSAEVIRQDSQPFENTNLSENTLDSGEST